MVCYMYQEGKKFWVVYGDRDGFFGPSEKCFNSKKEAEEFMKLKKKELGVN